VDVRFEGRTESQVAAELNEILAGEGLERADWGPIVAGGPNSASAHHITGGRVLQEGDAVILDFGGVFGGYQADITRTVHVGTPTEDFARVYDTVRRAQELAFAEASPGIPAQDVDRAARRAIEAAGYGGYLVHRTGHGLGLDTHEEPYIVEGNSLLLEPGMVFSIEPGAYLPGRFGVRIEDTVAVMPEGPRRLNEATRELVLVQ
jgi:D-alanyl-D-alanine dipeptidase